MKTKYAFLYLTLLAGLTLFACGESPLVVQGTVVSYDSASKTLVMVDETDPARQLTLSLESAEMGTEPITGDKVRSAYNEAGGKLSALRVMNLSHQIK